MNRFTKRLSWAALISVLFFIFGCSDELISAPISEGSSSAVSNSKNIQSPTSLVATHGKVNKIELSWMSSVGAKLYKIYASDSPFSDFVQIGEVSGEENFFTVEETSGVSKYFKITASDSNKKESSFSNVAFGSTLATPIITRIEMGVAGTSATVKWWMENCTTSTYAENVLYEVTAYTEDLTTLVGSATSSGTNLFAEINGLTPKTKYFFQVEAYLNSDQTAIELSEKVDEETARKLVPNPVENLVIDEGISENKINLSFDLPDYCDVSVGKGSYERHPLYFTIQRKEKDAADRTYETLVSYLGTMLDSSKATDDKIVFDCNTSTSTSELIKVEQSTSEDAEVNSAYPLYISKSKITYTDKTAKRGKQYTYKIQSFVDDVKKNISSDESVALSDGWLISIASLRVTGTYVEGEDNKYSNISFKFAATFNNYGKEYSYILKTIKTDLEGNNGEPSSNIFDSLESLNAYKIDFSDLETNKGFYKYSLFICPKNSTSESDAITSTNAPGSYIVTDDMGAVPNVATFEVKDGYSNKFILSWDYNEKYNYKLIWNDIDENGITKEEDSLELTNVVDFVTDNKVTYDHDAVSGVKRIYRLEANNGIHKEFDPINKDSDNPFETLGTAKIQTSEKEYDSITFSWDKVQKATDYEIHAYYSDDESKTEILNTEISSEYTINSDDANGILSCKIDKPIGYDDATKSGKDVVVKVIAKNTETNSTTEKTEKTATLGPANVNATIVGNRDNLVIEWNKIADAKGYLVYRTIYKDGTATTIDKGDVIYVTENSVSVSSESVGDRADITVSSSKFVMKDFYKEVTDSESAQTSYQINQSKIAWGLPFGYFIVPVKSDSDFTFDYSNNTITSSGKVAYSNINDVKGATYGYGLNVKASKATSANAVMVSWTKPYEADSKSAALYRKLESENSWTYLNTINSGASSYSYTVNNETVPYEYAVLYNGTNSSGEVFYKSFVDSLKETKDTISTTEQANKGYALTLTNVQANTGSGFSESVSWSPYNFSERTIGPDYYELQVGNYNKKNVWTTIAKITPNVANGDLGKTAVIQNSDINKVTLTSDNYSATVTPTFDSDNCSTGVLQVLRDAKHYYRLVAVRTFKDENESDVTIRAYSSEAYAYREITSEELIKIASICINDGLYQIGKLDFENESHNGGNGGTVVGKHEATAQIGKKYSITFSDYTPSLKTPNENNVSIAKINGQLIGYRNSTTSGSYPVYFDEKEITVSALDSNLPSSYSGTVKFKISSKENAEISSNNSVIKITSNEQRRKWIPWQFYGDDNWYHESTSYGWWED